MKETLKLRIYKDRSWDPIPKRELGVALENGVTTLEIELPRGLEADWKHYLEYKKPNGDATSTTEILGTIDAEGTQTILYDVASGVIDQKGNYEMSYTARNITTGQIWKSKLLSFEVSRSINAAEALQQNDDFVAKMEEVIISANATIQASQDTQTSIEQALDVILGVEVV